jgi:uncharacterized UPF0160 family protein
LLINNDLFDIISSLKQIRNTTMNFKVFTHSQQFHIDELIAIALLDIYFFVKTPVEVTRTEIVRTRDEKILEAARQDDKSFVIDVGGSYNPAMLNFDHHQNDESLRWEDGLPLSSCGLIWKFLRETKKLHQKMDEATMNIIENDLIRRVDKHDNGLEKLSELIFLIMYNRKPNDPAAQDRQFKMALRAAKDYFINYFTYIRGNMEAEKEIVKAIEKSKGHKDIVVCTSNIKDASKRIAQLEPEKKMVIYPHSNGMWAIKTVPSDPRNDFSQKCPAPKEWLGLKDKELEDASGINGLYFCHKGGFLTFFRGSIEDAIKVARVIILKHEGHM